MAALEGKTALVTGGAGRIGRAICARLAADGARVMVADLDRDRAAVAAGQIGANAMAMALDVADEAAWRAALDTLTGAWGRLDILVNNAGLLKPATIEEATLDDWRATLRVNGDGTFLGCKFGVAAMRAAGGVIVNLSSSMGVRAQARHPAYCASKAAVRLLTQSVAKHCGERGYAIRVVALLPGPVDSEMLRRNVPDGRSDADYLAEVRRRVPVGRLGRAEDIAGAVAYLVSDQASFITGTDFMVDGGSTL